MIKTDTFWKNKNILITGGSGFLGKYVVNELERRGVKDILIPRSINCDLREKRNCQKVVRNKDIVIHLAGNVGGIGYNQENPGSLFYDNITMGVHLIEEARKADVKKFVTIGTICAYPKFTPVPFKEKDLWNGYPEETNASYGLAKKMLLIQGQAYRQQYGFNSIYLLPVNLYGPGDKYDPSQSHVIPALIKKIVEAKRRKDKFIIVWGTGQATREFLYVEDCAKAILLAVEKYNKPDPINIGSGNEISIKELVEKIRNIIKYKGEIVWDKTKPDGQLRRKLDTSLAYKEFTFKAKTHFLQGLEKTINWYIDNMD